MLLQQPCCTAQTGNAAQKGATVVCFTGTNIFESKPFSPQREARSLGRHFQLQWGGQGGGARVAAHHGQCIHPADRGRTAV